MPFLTDGYQTLLTFELTPNVLLKAREVQPPDLDGAGEIDTTVMLNNILRTKRPKSLITMGEMTLQAQYDPAVYQDMLLTLNVNQRITVRFPDGARLTFFGWIGKFTPASLKEGEFPLAEVKVYCSNSDENGEEFTFEFQAA